MTVTLKGMNTWTGAIPVDKLGVKASQVRPGRVLLTVIAAVGVVAGWTVSKAFRGTGWLGGRAWMVGCFFTEAVIYGFREGAGLPQKAGPPEAGQGQAQAGPPS